MNATFWGIVGIGFIIGWLVYYAVRRTKNFRINTIAAVIGVIAGGAISKFFGNTPDWLGPYGIGLAAGFISYLVVALVLILSGKSGPPSGSGPTKPPEIVLPGPVLLRPPLDDPGSQSRFDAVAGVQVLDTGDALRNDAGGVDDASGSKPV